MTGETQNCAVFSCISQGWYNPDKKEFVNRNKNKFLSYFHYNFVT